MNKNGIFCWLVLLAAPAANAEYWLSNRFAQNCAACHAPGRINRPTSERRCTLSCQGCHVNPNGGGLVSSYGMWTQQHWLRSIFVEKLRTNKRPPAPFAQQIYAKKKAVKEDQQLSVPGTETVAAPTTTAPLQGHPLMRARDFYVNDKDYDRRDGQEDLVAQNEMQFLERVPVDDPYREERSTPVFGGGQFRYMAINYLGAAPPGVAGNSIWPMSVEVGMRFRPIPEHLNLVIEGRYLNRPQNGDWDQMFTNEPRIRSAYALFDNLPYNAYFMYGLYRPMFGLYNPDHTMLPNVISGLRQRSVFKAVGIGAAPNIPFFNFNLITPLASPQYDQSKGFVLNVGGRWVMFGASLVFSLWKTYTLDSAGNHLNNTMYSLTAGMAQLPFILNAEFLYVKRDFAAGAADAGTTFSLQGKYKLWREVYAEANFSLANTAMNLKQGAATEFSLGARGFLFVGTDVELLYVHRKNETPTSSTTADAIQAQLHLFL